MVQFTHEEPQGTQHTADLAASLTTEGLIEAKGYSPYDPIVVLEGKRLPAPSVKREQEYIWGQPKPTGGVQRFRLGLHGANHGDAVMVGYIQAEDGVTWMSRLNSWLLALAGLTAGGLQWSKGDLLTLDQAGPDRTFRLSSSHDRVGALGPIEIAHLWVEM